MTPWQRTFLAFAAIPALGVAFMLVGWIVYHGDITNQRTTMRTHWQPQTSCGNCHLVKP